VLLFIIVKLCGSPLLSITPNPAPITTLLSDR